LQLAVDECSLDARQTSLVHGGGVDDKGGAVVELGGYATHHGVVRKRADDAPDVVFKGL